jgi:hypothetical protein
MNARVGAVEGEKALFRLLAWTEGNFSFTPGQPPPRVRITRGMDDALLEGFRQVDEVARLLPSLPARHVRVHLAPEADLPPDQHPVTSEVVELLRQPRAIGELVDLAQANDLEILAVLSTLMQKGVVRIAEGGARDSDAGPLLGPAEIHALRARLFRGRVAGRVAVGKIFVCGSGPGAARRILSGVPGLQLASAEPAAVRSGFGTLARYEISEALQIDFCVLPPVEAAKPLWRPFVAGALGALLMDDSEQAARMAAWLAFEARVPVGTIQAGMDLLEATRGLLMQEVSPAQQPAHLLMAS